MGRTAYPRAYIEERGVTDPVLLDAIKQAADVYHFIHSDGVYKGDRVFRAAEIASFLQALDHPAVVPITGTACELHPASYWRRKLIWLGDNSACLQDTGGVRGSVGELLIAYVLQERELVFKHRGLAGTNDVYLALDLTPPTPAPQSRYLVSLLGSGIMCVDAYPAHKAKAFARRYASEIYPGVGRERWDISPITRQHKYD